jgi:hypothetical protein
MVGDKILQVRYPYLYQPHRFSVQFGGHRANQTCASGKLQDLGEVRSLSHYSHLLIDSTIARGVLQKYLHESYLLMSFCLWAGMTLGRRMSERLMKPKYYRQSPDQFSAACSEITRWGQLVPAIVHWAGDGGHKPFPTTRSSVSTPQQRQLHQLQARISLRYPTQTTLTNVSRVT